MKSVEDGARGDIEWGSVIGIVADEVPGGYRPIAPASCAGWAVLKDWLKNGGRSGALWRRKSVSRFSVV